MIFKENKLNKYRGLFLLSTKKNFFMKKILNWHFLLQLKRVTGKHFVALIRNIRA